MGSLEPVGDHTPSPRIGDAERDEAIAHLQTHLSQGRLEAGEFDERVDACLKARTTADLEPLFRDLPEPRPGSGSTVATPQPVAGTQVERPQRLYTFLGAAAVLWGAFVLLLLVKGAWLWWLGFFVASATGVLARYCGLEMGDRSKKELPGDDGQR